MKVFKIKRKKNKNRNLKKQFLECFIIQLVVVDRFKCIIVGCKNCT